MEVRKEIEDALTELHLQFASRPVDGGSTVDENIAWKIENEGLDREAAILACLKEAKSFIYL